jgi:hypothetical protein
VYYAAKNFEVAAKWMVFQTNTRKRTPREFLFRMPALSAISALARPAGRPSEKRLWATAEDILHRLASRSGASTKTTKIAPGDPACF